MTTYATLPQSLEIDGVTHVQHWKTKRHAIYQTYTLPVTPSDNPLTGASQVSGQNRFDVFEVIQHVPAGESLGERIAEFTDLNAAMSHVAKLEQLA